LKKQRLVCIRGTSSKFCEVSTSAAAIVVSFGRIGGTSRDTRTRCASPAAATAKAKALIRDKLANGYKKATTTSHAKPGAPGWHVVKRLVHAKAKKWRELEVEGLRLTIRAGRLGRTAADSTTTRMFESNHRARQSLGHEAHKLELHHGYTDTSTKPRKKHAPVRVPVWKAPAKWRAATMKKIVSALDASERAAGGKPRYFAAATPAAIARHEKALGVRLPPSFRELLRLHNGGEDIWGELCIVGVPVAANRRLVAALRKQARFDGYLDEDDDDDTIEERDALVFGTDRNRALWLFDKRASGPRGELQVVYMSTPGSVDQRFESLRAFLIYCVIENELA